MPEPKPPVADATRLGILLLNLGTPDRPDKTALRTYLRQFLSDPRVVELPRWLWWPILYAFILTTRPAQSAKKYASVWDAREGSPLRFHTQKQAKLLEGWLAQHLQQPFMVDYAMRYGNPSVDSVMNRMSEQGCDRILCLPLYPQYAASSSASALDAVFAWLQNRRVQPAVRTVSTFYADTGYIQAVAANILAYWGTHGRPDVLVMSFHGIPRRAVNLGDPYERQCLESGHLIARELGLPENQYRITFQSRFGRAEWLKPYTASTLDELGLAKTGRVDVVCPGFVADCLETLEEIAMEVKAEFVTAGGGEFHYIPALNESSAWIDALGKMTVRQLQGWI